jgi:uncharacterized protein DUF2865
VVLVNHHNRLSVRRLAVLLIALAHAAAWTSTPAAAEGPFEFLFGNARPEPALPQQALSYAKPTSPATLARPAPSMSSTIRSQPSAGSTQAAAYCVRLCDGRFFPIERHRAASAVELCNAFCPSSQTKVFSGSNIANSVAADGSRYAKLTNAFVFRKSIIQNCTCNGKDHFGIARLDANADPTLRSGDLIATANGRVTTAGAKSDRPVSLVHVSLSR